AATAGPAGCRLLLHDRRGIGDLLLRVALLLLRVALLRIGLLLLRIALLWLAVAGLGLHGLCRRLAGSRGGGDALLAGCSRGRAAELAQPLLELTVAILQFLVLAGELAQLLLQPLDAHLRIRIIRLR